jgi:hypothetical protein
MGRPSEQCDITKFTVDLGKMKNPGTNVDLAVSKIVQ